MGIAAPVILAEMAEWVALGGGSSGIVGNATHTHGFHVAANELPATDYSRWRDPQGSDGPYVNWSYACAGDFSHKNDENLRAMHRNVLARLMRGELPMICEFIGKPWAGQPIYYWSRWNGIGNLQRYTGSGHDHWSHISWYRSMVDQRAFLWVPSKVEDDDMLMYGVYPGNQTVWAGNGVQCRPVSLGASIIGGWNAVVNYPSAAALFDKIGHPLPPPVDTAALTTAVVNAIKANPVNVDVDEAAIAAAVAAAVPKPLTAAETVQASFEGAQRAERE